MKTYTLTHPAYGQPTGTTIALDDTDPLVQMNVDNGVLIPGSHEGAAATEKMTCPICTEHVKNPPKLSDPPSLEAHYEEKHAGYVVPSWHADTEEE